MGISFDGDADRVIFTDENGEVVDGDIIMGICARQMKLEGRLNKKYPCGDCYEQLRLREIDERYRHKP
ncbi:MAG: hypothetical protein LRY51_05100 [Geovibrio sp.]|nr:hypothetical protein [Geovibrio sp.]